MITITPTAQMIKTARVRSTGLAFNKNTERPDGSGQPVGNLGEIVFGEYLNELFIEHQWVGDKMFFHDFEIGLALVDVKAKRRTVSCGTFSDDWDVHIETRLEDKPCHAYVFISVVVPKGLKNPSSVEIWGWLTHPAFWNHPELKRFSAQEKDSDGFFEKMAAAKLKKQHLQPIETFIDRMRLHLYKKAFGEPKMSQAILDTKKATEVTSSARVVDIGTATSL